VPRQISIFREGPELEVGERVAISVTAVGTGIELSADSCVGLAQIWPLYQ
jgi:hypothetical protein